LDPSIDRVNGRTGKWGEDEDVELKDAVETHGDKDWVAVASMIPGRTRTQCYKRWHDALDPDINQSNGRTGKGTVDEDSKLTGAIQVQVAKIRSKLPRSFWVERKNRVGRDGLLSWIPASTRQLNVRVIRQEMKSSS
jgi:hypothetical protein